MQTTPLLVAQVDAQEAGQRFAARRRWIGVALLLAGIALVVGGFAGFGVFGDRAERLQKNGVHTTATVTDAVLYGGGIGGANGFTEHIDVAFTAPSGRVQGVRIPIGEDDRFTVGQRVEISYDADNPHRAVLAHGSPDIGPIIWVFFALIAGGVYAVVYAVKAIRLANGAQAALVGPSRTLTVESQSEQRGRVRRTALVLGDVGERSAIWATVGSGWPLPRTAEATVFGTGMAGTVVVIVDPLSGATTAGRIWKRRRVAD